MPSSERRQGSADPPAHLADAGVPRERDDLKEGRLGQVVRNDA